MIEVTKVTVPMLQPRVPRPGRAAPPELCPAPPPAAGRAPGGGRAAVAAGAAVAAMTASAHTFS